MREILSDPTNCVVNEVKCAHLRGGNWCELLKANIAPVPRVSAGVKECPDWYASQSMLRVMEFRTMLPILADDPMKRLNQAAIEREAKRPEVLDFGISPSYDKLPS